MEAHTPKREAIEKFIGHESGGGVWIIRTVDDQHEPVVHLQAFRDDRVEAEPEKTLEVHTRQVRLEDDELDEATKTMIRRWMASL
jgi:hypothetical protein